MAIAPVTAPPPSKPALPPSSVLQVLTCREGSKIDVHSRTEGLERKYSVVRDDGTHGTVLVWSGSNLIQSQNLMSQFQDRSRSRFRCVNGNRHFQVAEPSTQASFETSGQSADDAKAILFINGTLTTGEQAKHFFAAADGLTMGKTFGSIPGIIAKIFLASIEGGVVGGCYLFRDAQSIEDYLASDTWASARADTPWENVSIEKFTVVDEAAEAA